MEEVHEVPVKNSAENITDVFDFEKYHQIYAIMTQYFEGLELYLRTASLIQYMYVYMTKHRERKELLKEIESKENDSQKYEDSKKQVQKYEDSKKRVQKKFLEDLTNVFEFEHMLTAWYAHFNKDKLPDVSMLLVKYRMYEDTLFNRLYRKYVDLEWNDKEMWFSEKIQAYSPKIEEVEPPVEWSKPMKVGETREIFNSKGKRGGTITKMWEHNPYTVGVKPLNQESSDDEATKIIKQSELPIPKIDRLTLNLYRGGISLEPKEVPIPVSPKKKPLHTKAQIESPFSTSPKKKFHSTKALIEIPFSVSQKKEFSSSPETKYISPWKGRKALIQDDYLESLDPKLVKRINKMVDELLSKKGFKLLIYLDAITSIKQIEHFDITLDQTQRDDIEAIIREYNYDLLFSKKKVDKKFIKITVDKTSSVLIELPDGTILEDFKLKQAKIILLISIYNHYNFRVNKEEYRWNRGYF